MLATMLLNLGVKMANKGDLAEAEKAFRQAIEIDSKYAKAYNNLGFILYKQNRLSEAEAYLCQAIELNHAPDAYNNLALVFMDTDRLDKAEVSLRRAIKANPKSPEIYNNLGLVLEDTNRLKEAENSYHRAIKLKPDYAEAYYNLGNFLKKNHRLGAAENAYLHAIKLSPNFKDAQFALATLYLLRGQFAKGWESYNELRMKKLSSRQAETPLWQGEDLTGCSILLFHEQGFGDTLQFVRYAGRVAELAKTVLWVQKPLERLIVTSHSNLTVYADEKVPDTQFDFACPLPNLPMIFKATDNTIPKSIPYINVSGTISAHWREVLKSIDGGNLYRVGVVWAGNPKHHNDHNRSIPFNIFRGLFDIKKVSWVSLQVGQQTEELSLTSLNVANFAKELTDFAETAGMIANLELVITVDSAVAHLAGAMGKETWLLLPFLPDWRWQLERTDSPWYPTMHLFRQREIGNWQDVIKQVKLSLERKLINT